MSLVSKLKNLAIGVAHSSSLASQVKAPLTSLVQPQTLLVYEESNPSRVKEVIREELRKRYFGHLEERVLSKEFPSKIVDIDINSLIGQGQMKKPKQVVVLADYKSYSGEAVKVANEWVRHFDNDPFPDAKISFFPVHHKYTDEMVRLATRKPYKTERVLNNTFCGLHWDSLLDTMDGSELQANAVFSKMSKKELERYIPFEFKTSEKGNTTVSPSKIPLTKEYFNELNSGNIDLVRLNGEVNNYSWDISGLTEIPKSFSMYGSDNKLLLKDPVTNKFLEVGSINPKIIEIMGGEQFLPPRVADGKEMSLIMSGLIGTNSYVWGRQGLAWKSIGDDVRGCIFFDHGGVHSFTDSIFASRIGADFIGEKLRKGSRAKTKEEIDAGKNEGMFYGLPDSLTYASPHTSFTEQSFRRSPGKNGYTSYEFNFSLKHGVNHRAPVFSLLDDKIAPLSIQNLVVTRNGKQIIGSRSYDKRNNLLTLNCPTKENKGRAFYFTDDIIMAGVTPLITTDSEGFTCLRYGYSTEQENYKVSFNARGK